MLQTLPGADGCLWIGNMSLLRLLIALSFCFVAGVARAECSLSGIDFLPERASAHLPEAHLARSMPLVILLHGSTGTGAEMLRDSHLGETADRHGFIVVAPDAGSRRIAALSGTSSAW